MAKSEYIVSVDAGNGMTDAVVQKSKGYGYTRFPSVRATATGDSLGLGRQFEQSYNHVDWAGHRYLFGDEAIQGMRRGIERHQGANRYGNEFHKFLVACAVAQLGIVEGEIDLTLFAPPGMYNTAKPTMEKYFMEGSGNVAIQFANDKKPRKWKYTNIRVQPEGIGAAACFMLDESGCIANASMLAGQVVILDLGMHTLDALHMADGNFNPESLATATWENGGIKTHILEPMLNTVKKMGDDFTLLTLDDIDAVLRRGIQTDDWTLTVAGKSVDLREPIQKRRHRYAEWVANNIVDGVFNGMRGMRALIPVGGGARLIQDILASQYNDKILRFGVDGATKNIDPMDANAIGGLRLAKFSLKGKK
jgi:hypothetical protein